MRRGVPNDHGDRFPDGDRQSRGNAAVLHDECRAPQMLPVDGAHGGRDDSGEDAEQSGLSGPVGADKRRHLSARDRGGELVQDGASPVPGRHPGDMDSWRRHGYSDLLVEMKIILIVE